MMTRRFLGLALALFLAACGGGGSAPASAASAYQAPMFVSAWGDSLTHGFGVELSSETYPGRLSTLLAREVREHGVGGETSSQILVRILAPDASSDRDGIAVLWMGRNNFTDGPRVLSDIASAVSNQQKGSGRFLVLSLLNASNEMQGSPLYSQTMATNAQLASVYADRYVDVRKALIEGYDPSKPQDVVDRLADVTPSSLRVDVIHLNARGYDIVARAVAGAIRRLNW